MPRPLSAFSKKHRKCSDTLSPADMPNPRKRSAGIATVNLEQGMPLVHEALSRLDGELAAARSRHCPILKLVHGYGSSGVGGDLRIAVQKRLRELQDDGSIHSCIFGEDWGTSDARAWNFLKLHPEFKSDPDLGRSNRGITIVVL